VLLNEPSRPALIIATKGRSLVGAPSLPWEVGNALVAGVRRGQVSARAVQQAWDSYGKIPIHLAEIEISRALALAMELHLYAYDAYVLEVARAGRIPLLTLDRALARAAGRAAVPLVEWEP